MRIVAVGDVIGKPGRRAVREWLRSAREQEKPDLIVVNAENSAGGVGLTPDTAEELFRAGADCLTTGNHAFSKREVLDYLDHERVVRPANYPSGAPGAGMRIIRTDSAVPVAIINLQGRTFMDPLDSPFTAVDGLLEEARRTTPVVLIDFHAEATAEKQAFGWYVSGRASAVWGTHTHVQTADERLLPPGTAFITDLGMTGPVDSVIGMDVDIIVGRFLSQLPTRFEVAEGPCIVSAAIIDIDQKTGRALAIRRRYDRVE